MCGAVAQKLLSTISHRVLRTIIRHLVAAIPSLERTFARVFHSSLNLTKLLLASDVPFVLRMVVQSLLPGSPPDLTAEGQSLSDSLHTVVPPGSSDIFIGLNEECPACKAEVQLENITSAVCPSGHTWRASSLPPSYYL